MSLRFKEHAEDVDVQQGRVRLLDKQGNSEAADLGLLEVRSHWYPIMLDLHRFIIAVARVSVNHDGKGGTAPDPLVRDPEACFSG